MQPSYSRSPSGHESFDMYAMYNALPPSPLYQRQPSQHHPTAHVHAPSWLPHMSTSAQSGSPPLDWRHTDSADQRVAFSHYPPWSAPFALPLYQYSHLETSHAHRVPTRPDRVEQGRARSHAAEELASPSPSTSRGPPRKPKRSGYAVWVGNLPPFTKLIDLKDHFSTGATQDIESVFLMSKSTCAFVNYRTEAASVAAVRRFQNSHFLGRTLACKLRVSTSPARSSSTENAAPPLPPVDASASAAADEERGRSSSPLIVGAQPSSEAESPVSAVPPESPAIKVAQKFFILKSLTARDLEASRVSNKWATQPHNEDALKKAFAEAEAVYLIFSANKSGEYFGYARMTSTITQTPVGQSAGAASRTHEDSNGGDAPLTFITPATATAPEGRVVDDAERGTIFWESILSSSDDAGHDTNTNHPANWEQPDRGRSALRGTFDIEWISLNKIPFYRTRGMRNAWNGHKEVKIARDGTELEPRIAGRLLQLFHFPVQ